MAVRNFRARAPARLGPHAGGRGPENAIGMSGGTRCLTSRRATGMLAICYIILHLLSTILADVQDPEGQPPRIQRHRAALL